MDDGCYIEDLDTKNGTKINGNEIKGLGKIKLENQDEILVAKTLPIKYLE
ncbi:MAG: FHA domain-containing protein [Methanothermobacter sp.]|nr:FHA domain-containing protein [Methanothermobacter sp.]